MRHLQFIAVGLFACISGGAMLAQEPIRTESTLPMDAATNAIARVTAADKYAIVIFYVKGEGLTTLRDAVSKAVEESKGKAQSVEIDATDPGNQPTVRKYGLSNTPLPIVLVIAPNGAVTGGFPGSCDTKALRDAMVGKSFAACLKGLQEGKIVFVVVTGTNEATSQAAMKGVKDMAADKQFAGATETIRVQAGDKSSTELLAKLKVADAGKTPLTLLLVPPGRVVGTYTGLTEKATMISDVTRAMSGAT